MSREITKENLENMRTNAISLADQWFNNLSIQEQMNCIELAHRVSSQSVVMRLDGDQRRGLEVFPDAWKAVRNPLPKYAKILGSF